MTWTWIEIASAVASLLYVWLAARANIWAWPFGFLGSVLALWVYFDAKLYAEFSLYIFYALMALYGWYSWKKSEKTAEITKNNILQITWGGWQLNIIIVAFCTALAFGLGFFFKTFTDADLPYWDATTTSFSLLATWLTARKYIENWLYWFIINTLTAVLYLTKELYVFSGLYAIYIVMSVYGYVEWRKKASAAPAFQK